MLQETVVGKTRISKYYLNINYIKLIFFFQYWNLNSNFIKLQWPQIVLLMN